MNKYIIALTLSTVLAACQQSDAPKEDTKSAPATAVNTDSSAAKAAPAVAEKDQMSYALGASLAQRISGISDDFPSIQVNNDVVNQGFKDALAKASSLSDDQIREQLQAFQMQIQIAQQQKAQENIANNKVYLDKMATEGFTKTESGLLYKVITPAAEGAAKPTATDQVSVNYAGTFTDGKEFDSNADRGPFNFSLAGGVIKGWLEGVALMNVGSKYRFIVPPELGYGSRPQGPIPAESVLVFDVELLDIIKPEATEAPKEEAKEKATK